VENQETETTEQKDSRNFAAMRTRAEQAEERNKALEQTVKEQAVQIAGFDPKDPMVGLVAEKWAPEDGKFDADAFKAHAESFKLKPATSTESTATTTQAESQLDALQTAGDALRNGSTQTSTTPSVKEQIAKAQADGDWETASRLKTQSLLESQRPSLTT
jgi:hypothetical protein